MQAPNYSFEDCYQAALKAKWEINDLLPDDAVLSFDKPLLPNSLTGIDQLNFLSYEEALVLNHILSHSYINLFAFVEEYIIKQIGEYVNIEKANRGEAYNALKTFMEEEVKHQKLFHKYKDYFVRDFKHELKVLGHASDVADIILSKHPIAVMLITLQLEFMTQGHYMESICKSENIDPVFAKILKYHWLEEAQHAKIDHLELYDLIENGEDYDINKCFDEYFEVLSAFDGLLFNQMQMDIDALQAIVNRPFSKDEIKALKMFQMSCYRNIFIVQGMENENFLKIIEDVSPIIKNRLVDKTRDFKNF